MAVKCGACKGRHEAVAEVRGCYDWKAQADTEAANERYAETYVSNKITGMDEMGARTLAMFAAAGRDYFAEYDAAMAEAVAEAGQCEHGLSAALCAGPGHYPADDPMDDWF